ncbi:hypothetical protein QWZ13_18420 [Reinekea marina]|nr:hypothetical protein [Reinekea marina]MDN3650887.1 hypothetical protein [Reinekea marina]
MSALLKLRIRPFHFIYCMLSSAYDLYYMQLFYFYLFTAVR